MCAVKHLCLALRFHFMLNWFADPAAGAARHGGIADDVRHVYGVSGRNTVPAGAGQALWRRLPDALQWWPGSRLAAAVAVSQQQAAQQVCMPSVQLTCEVSQN